ncbi:hypothetical protein [Brucella pseudogrignonensis]|uniref:Lipoprotein n=1 Tax=Brucella pseudogrignonensis TaxID=419475 RepID=A0ABU1M5G4_9HYPH|nr:hypothetical protein [Brucella pseudogrignonensis]MDR6431067.1 hypothetical protein [Brucella pseudogrignonensis]
MKNKITNYALIAFIIAAVCIGLYRLFPEATTPYVNYFVDHYYEGLGHGE